VVAAHRSAPPLFGRPRDVPRRAACARHSRAAAGRCRAAALSHAAPGPPLSSPFPPSTRRPPPDPPPLPRRLRFKSRPTSPCSPLLFPPSLSYVHGQATCLSSTPTIEPPRPSPARFRPPSSPFFSHGETLPIRRHFPFWSRPHLPCPSLQLPELGGVAADPPSGEDTAVPSRRSAPSSRHLLSEPHLKSPCPTHPPFSSGTLNENLAAD
jgi:hypothetical protein